MQLLTFPSFNIPEKEKKEDYHRSIVQKIMQGNLNQSFSLRYSLLTECANFFNSINTGVDFEFLQKDPSGDAMPAKWMDLNTVRNKVKILMGEFLERGFDVSVKALNQDLVSKKLLEKDRLFVEMRLKPIAEALEQAGSLQFVPSGYIPENEEELEDYINHTYKATAESVMEAALKWLLKKQHFDTVRLALFRDLLIYGQAFAVEELVGSYPTTRRVDPRNVVFDPNVSDDFLSDATYWGEFRYMSLADCIEYYGLTKKEIDELTTAGKNFLQNTPSVVNATQVSDKNRIYYFQGDVHDLRILVFTAYWVDVLPWNHKIVKDKYNREHIKFTNKDKGDNIVKRHVKIWRKGTIIGNQLLKDWGVMENMVRSVDNYTETNAPFFGFIPNYINNVNLSLVSELKPIQDLKNIVAYNLQLALARSGAKGITIDVSQIPEGMDVDKVIKYLKVVGVNLIDSKKDGIPSQFNQFQQYDLTVSNNIVAYLNIMNALDEEMDKISGINPARQGIIQGATQTVGVTQAALLQSNISTKYLFKGFTSFATRILAHKAGLVKIAWSNKEQFAPIIGDVGVDFLKQDIELDLNDYGVFVEEVPTLLDDLNTFKQIVLAALQSGNVSFVDALDLLTEKDVRVGIRRFKKITAKREQEAAQQQQLMAQMQQQAEMAMNNSRNEVQREKTQIQAELERERHDNELQRILTKGRIDLGKEKLRMLKD